jgi:hypothetical protein
MVMGQAYYKHRVKFFPIIWREDDQVSNVKLTHQAITVLKLLGLFIVNKNKFISAEHRTKIIEKYTAQTIL